MARFDNLDPSRYPADEGSPLIASFHTYMVEQVEAGPEHSYSASQFVAAGREAKCLLDYAYVWLVEGTALQVCPSFGRFVYATVCITDEYMRPQDAGGSWGLQDILGEGLSIFYWGETQCDHAAYEAYERGIYDRELVSTTFRPPDCEGYGHPAMSRARFEYIKLNHELRTMRDLRR